MRISVLIKRIRGLASGKLHHYVAQRVFREQTLRNWLADRVAGTRPSVISHCNDAEPKDVQMLAQEGYVMLPSLISDDQIIDIKQYLSDKLCYDRNKPNVMTRFLPTQAPAGTHVAAYSDADVINCPHILRIANDKRVIALVESYLKCRPTIANLSVWWSLITDEDPEEAENFHRDIDDWRQLKLFIYLTDVGAGAGPHVFIRKSHRVKKALQIRRYSDDEVAKDFGYDEIVTFTGFQGTCFLENTFGLHKGTPARLENRLLLQVLYSMNPLGVSDYNPVARYQTNDQLDPYINRLYVR